MIEAVIIDLDDTLCLTEEVCFRMENELLESIGSSTMTRHVHQANWGKPLFEAILERSPGVDIDRFRAGYRPIIAKYTENGQLDRIPEENIQALDKLSVIGKALLILTSREHTELAHLLRPYHVLADRIEAFYYKDNMQFHKPDPRAFEHIEKEHGWKPEQCVYVGDSISDAIAAKQAGLLFVASLESGLRIKEDFADYQVDGFINTFPEVVEAVVQLDKAA